MTYFHYYATTSRSLDRVMQYGVFPISKALWLVALCKFCSGTQLTQAASDLARITSAGAYAGLTTAFLGAESHMIDGNAKEAVSAEMGVSPDSLRFSDYKYSDNAIAKKAHHDIMRLQKFRYGTDALFMLPIAMRFVGKASGIDWFQHSRDTIAHFEGKRDIPVYDPGWLKLGNEKGSLSGKPTFTQMMLNGHNAWDMSVLAGKAGYWAGETYFVDKSGLYEIVKVMENLGSTGKDISYNDMLAVYQRTRTNDRGLPPVERKEEYDKLRPLLQRMVDEYNKHDGTFGLSEIVYLIGLNKVDIHAPDHKNISQAAIDTSNKEIGRVLEIGLDGIREENRKRNEEQGIPANPAARHKRSFTERLGDGAVETAQAFSAGMSRIVWGKKAKTPEEYITPRNPGELAHWESGSGVNR